MHEIRNVHCRLGSVLTFADVFGRQESIPSHCRANFVFSEPATRLHVVELDKTCTFCKNFQRQYMSKCSREVIVQRRGSTDEATSNNAGRLGKTNRGVLK